jgi:hypothetical protein
MNGINPKMRAAIFEHLSKSGRLKPVTPHVPMAGTKIPQALVPPQLPNGNPLPSQQVNQNLVGNPRAQRFQKMRKMFGMG